MQLLLVFLLDLIMLMTLSVGAAVPPSAAAQKDDIWDWVCNDDNGNYTANSTFKSNLDALLNNITTLNITYGFYNFTTGKGPDQVYAIGLCRGDVVKVADCHSCLGALKANLTETCPTDREAIAWADRCMLHYSPSNILGVVETTTAPYSVLHVGDNVSGNVDEFQQVTEALLMSLPNKTAYGNSTLKYATGQAKVNSSLTVYGLMQCTPDLKPYECLGCIYWNMFYVLNEYNTKLRGQSGTRVATPSCSIRYDTNLFYDGPPPIPGKVRVNAKFAIACVLPITLAAAVILFSVLISLFVKRRQHDNMRKKVFNFKAQQMDYKIIKRATRNFSKKLGSEKSKVYEGKLESNRIAVKRITDDEASSDVEQFKNMVLITTKIQHHNIAEVLGYCIQDSERLIVFEFVSKGNLEEILFDHDDPKYTKLRNELDWKKRYAIIQGIAQGLMYLHQHRYKILHLDLKPANVLLDDKWNPKIIDIGTTTLFKQSKKKQSQDLPDLPVAAETAVLVPQKKQVNPYMAPEMHENDGIRSDKSDVYSFGVLVLEILAGRRSVVRHDDKEPAEEDLIPLARRTSKQVGLNCLEVIDPKIAPAAGQDSDESEIMKACLDIALSCVHEDADERPEMSTVVEKLLPSA